MKTILPFTLALGLAQGAFAQQAELTPVPPSPQAAAAAETARGTAQMSRALMERYGIPERDSPAAKEARRFDLDFPGGPPEFLIRVIHEMAGLSVNAIIPEDVADTQIPAMSVKNVTLKQLFEAIEVASRKTLYRSQSIRGMGGYQSFETSYGFRTTADGVTDGSPSARGVSRMGGSEPDPDENAIWHFYRNDPPELPQPKPVRRVRFYQLASYLDTFNVEDITTAIRTGWDLLEAEDQPRLKFHEETKLLIAVGDPELLETVDEVLAQLRDGLPSGATTVQSRAVRMQPVPPTPRLPVPQPPQ
ncbi:MAG: hypothetical protein H7A46_23110 [Verrucomicrobiales bacterium]|nr:hypothetical protein [Verrucomicrobiales bacterium]